MKEVGKLGKELVHSWRSLPSALGEEKQLPALSLGPSHSALLSEVPFSSVLSNRHRRPTFPFCPLLGKTYYSPSSIKDLWAPCVLVTEPRPPNLAMPASKASYQTGQPLVTCSYLHLIWVQFKIQSSTCTSHISANWLITAELDSAGKNMSIVIESSTG